MPTWHALVDEFNATPVEGRSALMTVRLRECVAGKSLVREWLGRYMFAERAEAEKLAESVREVSASDEHGSPGRRIRRDAARDEGVTVDDLEDDRSLQEAVLTLYHWSTIAFKQGPVAQSLISNTTPLQRRRRKNCQHYR